MKNAELERLESTIAQATKDLADLKAKLERDAQPVLATGQLWRNNTNDATYLAAFTPEKGNGIDLVNVFTGKYWHIGRGFDGNENQFTYIGMASDLLTIKASA